MITFAEEVLQGIPDELPPEAIYDVLENHAPVRKDILSREEKRLALSNALRYFPAKFHATLAPEFANELTTHGRIYMYRFRPRYPLFARPIDRYPHKSLQAAAIMLMIQNNLNPDVAQHPHELITYGANGAVFQNWAQYRLVMKYLATMTDQQTLHIYSGHPLGFFPSGPEAPRVVVTNGMMVPNYSRPDDWERFNALGVTQYGQMTAGSYMYIGPQGIVHGTTLTLLNAGRLIAKNKEDLRGKLFLSSGLGGMSGAQPKAAKIAGCISVIAEVNEKVVQKRHAQGWVDEVQNDIDILIQRVARAKQNKEVVSIAFTGNVVKVWERFFDAGIFVDLGSDQTSLHNPFGGGYYPMGQSFYGANQLMAEQPDEFKRLVQESLRRHVAAINKHTAAGTYFFDYGNAFLLEAARAGAEVRGETGREFRYPSYVQDIMGPLCFDFGFGPFRWVCTSCLPQDLALTDKLAEQALARMADQAPPEIQNQIADNLHWIRAAHQNDLVVGSQARILYADGPGRVQIALAFNEAIRQGHLSPVVLGRDHHDVSGTDSPYRETSNIYDGSRFTADMAVQNVIGDSFRGATWVSLHNGGGVGWGEAINGGFGMLLDGSLQTDERIKNMLHFDVNNGIARRAWARNQNARYAIRQEMQRTPGLQVTLPHEADQQLLNGFF